MTAHHNHWRMQVCAVNLLTRRADILSQLAKAGCIVETVGCLDECTRCESCALALVSGRIVAAATPEEFLAKLRL